MAVHRDRTGRQHLRCCVEAVTDLICPVEGRVIQFSVVGPIHVNYHRVLLTWQSFCTECKVHAVQACNVQEQSKPEEQKNTKQKWQTIDWKAFYFRPALFWNDCSLRLTFWSLLSRFCCLMKENLNSQKQHIGSGMGRAQQIRVFSEMHRDCLSVLRSSRSSFANTFRLFAKHEIFRVDPENILTNDFLFYFQVIWCKYYIELK